MNKTRKLCALIAAAVFSALSVSPALPVQTDSLLPVYAAEEEDYLTDAATGLHYTVINGTVTITGVENTVEYLMIPAEIDGYPVRTIGKSAFGSNNKLKSAVLSEGITAIMDYAFSGCRFLTSVQLPSTVTYIGEGAFKTCTELEELELPEGIRKINPFTFENCAFKQFVIPDSVTEIGESAFGGISELLEVYIPESVYLIDKNAFNYCQLLQYIIIPYGVISIGDGAFNGCINMSEIYLPESLLYIGDEAFTYNRSLKEITLPNSLLSIGDRAFYDTSITEFTIPDSVVYLGSGYPVNAVTETVDGVEYLGNWAVKCTDTDTSVTIREGTVGVASSAFSSRPDISDIYLPSTLRYCYGDSFNTFNHCLSELHISENNPDFCSVDGVLYSKDMTRLIAYPDNKPEEQFTVPDTVTEIDDYAFYDNRNLKSVSLPEGLTYIGDYAFYRCKSLSDIPLPEGLLRIGDYAFRDCDMETMDIPDSLMSMGEIPVSSYQNFIDDWVTGGDIPYSGQLDIMDTARGIADYSFRGRPSILSVNIPDSVEFIGSGAFWNCRELQSVTIGTGVLGIDAGAFADCISLKEIRLPADMLYMDAGAFSGCDFLEKITILSPDCLIYPDEDTIAEQAVIYGYRNSTAEEYAAMFHRKFVALEAGMLGDVNSDGVFDVTDVILLQRWILSDGTKLADWEAGDFNGDGKLDIFDLGLMKRALLTAD